MRGYRRWWTFPADSATRAALGMIRPSLESLLPEPDLNGKEEARAGSRSRQQRRSGPQGAEEEDAARGDLPRDEAARPLRKTLRKARPREGGSHPSRAQT